MDRLEYDEAIFITAYAWALRGTCGRRAVGAVIVDNDGHILSAGYNGVPSRAIHCIDQPCPGAFSESGADLDMCHAIHAEQNAITHCADIDRAVRIYTTTFPCMSCMKLLISTNIEEIIYVDTYSHDHAVNLWEEAGGIWRQYEPTTSICAHLRLEASLRPTFFKREQANSDRHGDTRPRPH